MSSDRGNSKTPSPPPQSVAASEFEPPMETPVPLPSRSAELDSRLRARRREFLQGLALGAGAAVLGGKPGHADEAGTPGPTPVPTYDFTRGAAALEPDRVVRSACQFCNSHCGLRVHMKNGRIVDVLGEADDPVQAGGLCIKASMMTQLVTSPERIRTPLKRVAGAKGDLESRFEPISWDEALAIVAKRFLAIRDEGAAHTIASRTTGRMARGSGALIHRFFQLLGSPNDTDVGPVCNDAGGNALAWTFGLGNFTNGYGIDEATGREDLGSAAYHLFLGTNQAETHPVTFAHLLRCRERTGAKLTVIDPRRTATGVLADRWVAIKPHTDLAFVLGMLSHIITQDLFDHDFVRDWVLGFDELKEHLATQGYTTAWAADVADVPEAVIVAVAEEYASAKPAAIFCNAGISHQVGAFDTYRSLAMLAAITGNIGVPGGGCNFMHNTWPGDLKLPPLTQTTPVRREALPVGPDAFADAILTDRPYRIRAVVTAGNPLLASSNSTKVAEAFSQLEFYAYTGLFMEESAYYADVILPVTSGLEMEGVYMRRDDRAIRWQKQAVPRVGESRPDWEIWVALAQVMEAFDTKNPPGYWSDAFPARWSDYGRLWSEFVEQTPGMGGMTQARMESRTSPLRWPCPTVEHPGVSTLYLDHPSWYQAAAVLTGDGRKRRFLTPSGRVEIATPEMDAALRQAGHTALPSFYTHPDVTGDHPVLHYGPLVSNPIHPHSLTPQVTIGPRTPTDPRTGETTDEAFDLMGVIGRPSVVHFAGVTQWTITGKQVGGERLIQIHPQTAARWGIESGQAVTVESRQGAVTGTALLWEGIRPDTVFVPSTFGPAQRVGDALGLPRYASANVLIDDRQFDNLSGQQAYKCFACRVRPA